MDLLSVSQLLTTGSIVHLEKGNSYILVKNTGSDGVRKVWLEEENGLFLLPLSVKGESQVSDSWSLARAHLAAASEKLASDSAQWTNLNEESEGGIDGASGESAYAFVGTNGASLELWHQRLGCSKKRISLMHKQSSALGLSLDGSRKAACKKGCMCSVCQLSRACKRSPAKVRVFEEECTRPFGVVHTDMKGPLLESHCGLRYSIVFIDHVTRIACTYYMSRKSEAAEKLRRYLSWVKKLG